MPTESEDPYLITQVQQLMLHDKTHNHLKVYLVSKQYKLAPCSPALSMETMSRLFWAVL
jgi:hypothetical protein